MGGNLVMTDADFARYAAMYDGELRYLDDHLSRLFEALRKCGALDDTVVIVTSTTAS